MYSKKKTVTRSSSLREAGATILNNNFTSTTNNNNTTAATLASLSSLSTMANVEIALNNAPTFRPRPLPLQRPQTAQVGRSAPQQVPLAPSFSSAKPSETLISDLNLDQFDLPSSNFALGETKVDEIKPSSATAFDPSPTSLQSILERPDMEVSDDEDEVGSRVLLSINSHTAKTKPPVIFNRNSAFFLMQENNPRPSTAPVGGRRAQQQQKEVEIDLNSFRL